LLKDDPYLIHQFDLMKMNPMHICAKRGHNELLAFFLKRKSKIEDLDNSGKSPLMHAVENECVEAIAVLMSAGASPWSNKYWNYADIVKSPHTVLALKSARKLDIVLMLSPLKVKQAMWKKVFPYLRDFPHIWG
jgi:ankyrin repeat protein